jgi:hypothetical protein
MPVIEESLFRLPLKFSVNNIAISLSVLFYFLLSKFIFKTPIINFTSFFFLRLAVSLIFFVSIRFILNLRFYKQLEALWGKNYSIIYRSLCLFFAWVHITNYDYSIALIMLMPLITLPQFIISLYLSYIRLKYGFLHSVIFHSAVNAIPFVISVLKPESQ